MLEFHATLIASFSAQLLVHQHERHSKILKCPRAQLRCTSRKSLQSRLFRHVTSAQRAKPLPPSAPGSLNRIACLSTIVGFDTAKAIASYRDQSILSNTLDCVLGAYWVLGELDPVSLCTF